LRFPSFDPPKAREKSCRSCTSVKCMHSWGNTYGLLASWAYRPPWVWGERYCEKKSFHWGQSWNIKPS